jgi:hypothetical protein
MEVTTVTEVLDKPDVSEIELLDIAISFLFDGRPIGAFLENDLKNYFRVFQSQSSNSDMIDSEPEI